MPYHLIISLNYFVCTKVTIRQDAKIDSVALFQWFEAYKYTIDYKKRLYMKQINEYLLINPMCCFICVLQASLRVGNGNTA